MLKSFLILFLSVTIGYSVTIATIDGILFSFTNRKVGTTAKQFYGGLVLSYIITAIVYIATH